MTMLDDTKGEQLTPYRTPAPLVIEVTPIQEHKGARKECPYCGCVSKQSWDERTTAYYIPVVSCHGANWFWRLLGGCSRTTPHLHQQCDRCNGKWICATKEIV